MHFLYSCHALQMEDDWLDDGATEQEGDDYKL